MSQEPQNLEPRSPDRQEKNQNSGSVVLSPKADAYQRLKNEQSPEMRKNKYETLKKLYDRSVEQKAELMQVVLTYEQKKEQLDGYKLIYDAKVNNKTHQEREAQIQGQRLTLLSHLQIKLQRLQRDNEEVQNKQEKSTELKAKLDQLTEKIQRAQENIASRQQSNKQRLETKKAQKCKLVENIINHLKNKRNQIQSAVNSSRNKVNEKKIQLQGLLQQIVDKNVIVSESGGNDFYQKRQEQLKENISNKKEQNQRMKEELITVEQKQIQQIPQAQDQLETLKQQIQRLKKVENQQEKSSNQESSTAKEQIQKLHKRIEKQKDKNHKLNDKVKKVQRQYKKLVEDIHKQQKKNQSIKKPKYEQKIPEQLVMLRKKKQHLIEEVKKEQRKFQQQNQNSEDMVPFSVVENYRNKIKNIIQRTQIYEKLTYENKTLGEQNQKLDMAKEQLEWEANPEIKNLDINKQKEENKSFYLEEEVGEIRKKSVQIGNKLEEYTKAYPEFKPQKKTKKMEAPQTVIKKQSQKEEKSKKRKNKGSPEGSPKLQEKDEIVEIAAKKEQSQRQETKPTRTQNKKQTSGHQGSKKNKKKK